jgi:hypothetical protein
LRNFIVYLERDKSGTDRCYEQQGGSRLLA